MSIRIILVIGLIVLAASVMLVGAAFAIAPTLPDGGQLSFSTESTFYVLDVNHGIRYPLLPATIMHRWSPDGGRVVYVRQVVAADSRVYDRLIVADMFEQESQVLYPLVAPIGYIAHLPAWSPFDPRIAFTYAGMDSSELELIVMGSDEDEMQTVDVSGMIPDNSMLGWVSADQLRYVAADGKQVILYELGLDDRQVTALRAWDFPSVSARTAVLSADGERFILPAITPTKLNSELYLFDTQSDDVQNLSNRPVHNDTAPVWSPDESRILFRALNDAGQFLLIMNADGSGQQVVFRSEGALITQALWSPDGRSVLVLLNNPGARQLCIVTIADGAINCPANGVYQASWRPAS